MDRHPTFARHLVGFLPYRMVLRLLMTLLVTVLLILLVLICGLYFYQDAFIYHPRPYDPESFGMLLGPARPVETHTDQGHQVSYYLAPAPDRAPGQLWLCFGGNASLALYLRGFMQETPAADTGFLLLEYPGYGRSEGRPDPESIQRAADATVYALLGEWGFTLETFPGELAVFGVSLGTGAGLQWAVRHRVGRVALISPFTSMLAMARRTVGWPLCHLLRHRFNNRAHLAALAPRSDRPAVTIVHGNADRIVPFSMGRALAAEHPEWIQFIRIPGGDHNHLLEVAEARIHEAMFPAVSTPHPARR